MQELAELERRISAALQRIGDGIEAAHQTAGTASPPPTDSPSEEIAQLTAELAAERALTDQLRAQLASAASPQAAPNLPATDAALQARIDAIGQDARQRDGV